MLQAIDEQRSVGKLRKNVVKRAVLEHFLGALALGDVAIDDDQSFQTSITVLNKAGSGFENAPVAVFVTHAIFESLPLPAGARLSRRLQHPLAIRRMYLINRRASAQLLLRIPQHL